MATSGASVGDDDDSGAQRDNDDDNGAMPVQGLCSSWARSRTGQQRSQPEFRPYPPHMWKQSREPRAREPGKSEDETSGSCRRSLRLHCNNAPSQHTGSLYPQR